MPAGEYAKLEREREKVKARMNLLKHHFKARKAGLEAVLDEVEDLVRRNTQEFMSEVEGLFEQSRQVRHGDGEGRGGDGSGLQGAAGAMPQ